MAQVNGLVVLETSENISAPLSSVPMDTGLCSYGHPNFPSSLPLSSVLWGFPCSHLCPHCFLSLRERWLATPTFLSTKSSSFTEQHVVKYLWLT